MTERNENLALDLDLFDDAKSGYVPVERKQKRIQPPRLLEPKVKTRAQVANETKSSRAAALKAVTFTMIALIVLGSLIYSRVVLTNLKSELASENAKLATSQSENVVLKMKFNSMMSMDKVAEYAQSKLGMVKRESYQVSYFDSSSSDGAQLTESGKVK